MSHPIWSEIRECLVQELAFQLSHKLTVSLPVPVLTAVGARRSPLRQQKGSYRADTEGALRH